MTSRSRARFYVDHEGHDVSIGPRSACCLTCKRGYLEADRVIIQRATDGGVKAEDLLPAERMAVVRALTAKGIPARQVADRLGMSKRHVERDLARLRELGSGWQVAS